MFILPEDHKKIERSLLALLTAIGIRQRRIVLHQEIELSERSRIEADMLVLADDGKTILFQFEIKLANGDANKTFCRAKESLRGLWHHHRCFAVTADKNVVQMAEVCDDGAPTWVPISDANRVAELLGDPKEESARQVARIENRRRETVAKDCKSLLWWIVVVGGTTLVSVIVGELFGKELSWKIYYLLTLVLGMIAAAHGLVFYVKVGDGEVRIVDRGKTVGEVVSAREDAKDESETDVTLTS